MRKILLVFVLFLFSACTSQVGPMTIQKSQFYTVKLADKNFYFKYPAEATIDGGVLSFSNCKVNFRQSANFEKFANLKLESSRRGKILYKAWYKDEIMRVYAGVIEVQGFSFWVESEEVEQNCVKLVEELVASFSDKLTYVNEKRGFSVKLPEDFKADYLPDGSLVLKKWIEKKISKTEPVVSKVNPKKTIKIVDLFEPYKVEIGVNFLENFEGYGSVGDFVGAKYPGYSFEFEDYGGFSGYYVNETLVLDAISHFFVLGDGGSAIFDIYMRVPGKRYNDHKKFFEEFVRGVELN